jgi:hypothetical protein
MGQARSTLNRIVGPASIRNGGIRCRKFNRNLPLTRKFARRFVMLRQAPLRLLDHTYQCTAHAARRRDRRRRRSTMRNTALTILGVALLGSSLLQSASAKDYHKDYHHARKAQRPPVAASQTFRDSNAAIWTAPRRQPNWYGPAVEPDRPNFYRDEALSPPAGH